MDVEERERRSDRQPRSASLNGTEGRQLQAAKRHQKQLRSGEQHRKRGTAPGAGNNIENGRGQGNVRERT